MQNIRKIFMVAKNDDIKTINIRKKDLPNGLTLFFMVRSIILPEN